MTFSCAHWQNRLDALRAAHSVPGATLAVFTEGKIHELASGILHRGTGVEATTDSVFHLGSMAKLYTATLVMQLAAAGELDLDAPVSEVLPEFSVADTEAAKTITARRLLSHTSGMTCDFTYDSGRGDDCLATYVAAARNVALDCPPGTAVSYSNVGYSVLGRIVEVLTGRTWDRALKERLLAPLSLTRTMTLPEEALAFRTAMGHVPGDGSDPEPAPAGTCCPARRDRTGGSWPPRPTCSAWPNCTSTAVPPRTAHRSWAPGPWRRCSAGRSTSPTGGR